MSKRGGSLSSIDTCQRSSLIATGALWRAPQARSSGQKLLQSAVSFIRDFRAKITVGSLPEPKRSL